MCIFYVTGIYQREKKERERKRDCLGESEKESESNRVRRQTEKIKQGTS